MPLNQEPLPLNSPYSGKEVKQTVILHGTEASTQKFGQQITFALIIMIASKNFLTSIYPCKLINLTLFEGQFKKLMSSKKSRQENSSGRIFFGNIMRLRCWVGQQNARNGNKKK